MLGNSRSIYLFDMLATSGVFEVLIILIQNTTLKCRSLTTGQEGWEGDTGDQGGGRRRNGKWKRFLKVNKYYDLGY